MTALWLFFIVGLGFLGFFLVIFMLVVRGVRYVLRPLLGKRDDRGVPQGPWLRCGGAGCGQLNRSSARFCARCGRPLPRVPQYVHHG